MGTAAARSWLTTSCPSPGASTTSSWSRWGSTSARRPPPPSFPNRPLTWGFDNVELVTVGVDIGSSTSHLIFAKLHLQRLTQSLSSRFAVVKREVLHRSPILLTPYRPDGLIDVEELERFVDQAYAEA